MALIDAIRQLNKLKQRRIIKDYAIMSNVAAYTYIEPRATQNMDVMVLVENDEQYIDVLQKVRPFADNQSGMHFIMSGVPIQLFPTTMSPLYEATLKGARPVRIGGIRTRVASPEHLILLALSSFRPIDRVRILELPEV